MLHRRFYYIAVLGLLSTSFLVNNSNLANAASDDGTGDASIIAAIGITADRNLDFGEIVPNAAGGGNCTVTLTAVENTVQGGSCSIVNGTPTSASFDVTGEASTDYVITVPLGNVNIARIGGGGASMNMSSLAHSYGAGNGTIGVGGTDTFYVGGTLTVSEAQMTGNYTGTFSVTVEYE